MSDGMLLLYVTIGLIVLAAVIAFLRAALGSKKEETQLITKS